VGVLKSTQEEIAAQEQQARSWRYDCCWLLLSLDAAQSISWGEDGDVLEGFSTGLDVFREHPTNDYSPGRQRDLVALGRGPLRHRRCESESQRAGNLQLQSAATGQYYDQETGSSYNYFRDYDPATGRYLESDPAGLAAGINTYAYVGANPLRGRDRLGLQEEDDAEREVEEAALAEAIVQQQVQFLLQRIQQYDPTYRHSVARPIGARADTQDVRNLQDVLRRYQSVSSCPAPGAPPIRPVHSLETILSGPNKYSYDYWSRQSTGDILRSLQPGQSEPLTVNPDGSIAQGNTRVYVLEQRGIDVNSLPRVTR